MRIAEIIEAAASAVVALGSLFALVFSVASLINSNHLKSYEFMINHRLKTFDLLQNRISELKHITSVEYIDAQLGKTSPVEYAQVLSGLTDELAVILSRSQWQEFLLLEHCGELKQAALVYYREPSEASGAELLKQADMVFVFADIYLWSLWQYLQQLYKKRKAQMPELFEGEFRETYEQAKYNYLRKNQKSVFFEKYESVEALKDNRGNLKCK